MRSISQIYSEAVSTRNNYLQLTELNSGRSNSKLSMINLLTYVVAVCIHTYETILDLFQVRLANVLMGRINGTPDWYATIAKKFQYNNVNGKGDILQFNEDTLQIEYVQVDTTRRIIEKAAWELAEDGLILKVCKANDNSNEVNNGIPYSPLNDSELTAFKQFIDQIKFVGADIYTESLPGDIVTIVADENSPIFFNDSYVTAAQTLTTLQQALVQFVNNMKFNSMLYYQDILDVIRKAEYITDVSNNVRVYVSAYNVEEQKYDEPVELINRLRLRSGYIRLLDENSAITVNSDNLTLIPNSKIDLYTTSVLNK